MAKANYLVNWTLKVDGFTYEAGDTVRMDVAVAEPLLGGVLSPLEEANDEPSKATPSTKKEQQQADDSSSAGAEPAAKPKRRASSAKDSE